MKLRNVLLGALLLSSLHLYADHVSKIERSLNLWAKNNNYVPGVTAVTYSPLAVFSGKSGSSNKAFLDNIYKSEYRTEITLSAACNELKLTFKNCILRDFPKSGFAFILGCDEAKSKKKQSFLIDYFILDHAFIYDQDLLAKMMAEQTCSR